jgi:hypothetical protein
MARLVGAKAALGDVSERAKGLPEQLRPKWAELVDQVTGRLDSLRSKFAGTSGTASGAPSPAAPEPTVIEGAAGTDEEKPDEEAATS